MLIPGIFIRLNELSLEEPNVPIILNAHEIPALNMICPNEMLSPLIIISPRSLISDVPVSDKAPTSIVFPIESAAWPMSST